MIELALNADVCLPHTNDNKVRQKELNTLFPFHFKLCAVFLLAKQSKLCKPKECFLMDTYVEVVLHVEVVY